MPDKMMHVQGIGDVTLKQNRRAKNITLRIVPGPQIIISAPRLLSERKARQVISEKQSWILKKLQSARLQKDTFKNGDTFTTLHHRIILTTHPPEDPVLRNECIYLKVDENLSNDETQEEIRIRIREIIRKEARAYLPQRVAWLAQQYNFSYNQIRIKDSKTRWGSCSAKKNINLSLYLMRLPVHLIDYIILHELCHTIHLNHGEKFHLLMNRLTGNNENQLRKELRRYSTGI